MYIVLIAIANIDGIVVELEHVAVLHPRYGRESTRNRALTALCKFNDL